jgi:hypothetical protein
MWAVTIMSKNIEHVQVRWCSSTTCSRWWSRNFLSPCSSEMVFINYEQHAVELEFSNSIWRVPYIHDKEKEGYYTNFSEE